MAGPPRSGGRRLVATRRDGAAVAARPADRAERPRAVVAQVERLAVELAADGPVVHGHEGDRRAGEGRIRGVGGLGVEGPGRPVQEGERRARHDQAGDRQPLSVGQREGFAPVAVGVEPVAPQQAGQADRSAPAQRLVGGLTVAAGLDQGAARSVPGSRVAAAAKET